jgi:polysulfide reductase chain C
MSSNIVWGWWVVLYLWLAGIGGGAYIAAYLVHNLTGGRHRTLLRLGTYVSIPVFALGMIFLTIDLGRSERFWHMFVRFRPSSVMWFGTYFLLIGTVVGAGLVLRELAELLGYEIANLDVVERVVTTLGFLFALIVVAYVGVLFAQTARSLWEATLLLPWLFIASALSTGIAALAIVLRIVPTSERPEVLTQLERLDVVFIVLELVLLAIFVIWLAGAGSAAQAALGKLITGGMGVIFWVGLVILGLVVPLALEWRALRTKATTPAIIYGAPLLVLLGGLVLRYVIVFAAQV